MEAQAMWDGGSPLAPRIDRERLPGSTPARRRRLTSVRFLEPTPLAHAGASEALLIAFRDLDLGK